MSIITCAYCGKPLERLSSVESEVGEYVREKTEYMCTNTQCDFSSRIIHEHRRPLQKQGYITVHMLQKRPQPKSGLRRIFGELAGQFTFW